MKLYLVTLYLTINFFSQNWGKTFLVNRARNSSLLVKTADTYDGDSGDDYGEDYQDYQVQSCSENCIKYLIKCNLLYADEDLNRQVPCNKEDKSTRGWKKSSCTKLQKGIIDLQKSANLWATGDIDDETWNLITSNTCPVNPAFQCSCNGKIDKKGEGECKTLHLGKMWCYVESNSACTDTKSERGTWWSYDACKGRPEPEFKNTTALQEEQTYSCETSGIIKYLVKCNLLYADEDHNRKEPCNKEDKKGKWKQSSCTKLEKGIIDLQKSVDLWATGEMDDQTCKLVKNNKCPVNPAIVCSCNGVIDKNGEGECRKPFEGEMWCYVVANSACRDVKNERGSYTSYDACKGRNVNH